MGVFQQKKAVWTSEVAATTFGREDLLSETLPSFVF